MISLTTSTLTDIPKIHYTCSLTVSNVYNNVRSMFKKDNHSKLNPNALRGESGCGGDRPRNRSDRSHANARRRSALLLSNQAHEARAKVVFGIRLRPRKRPVTYSLREFSQARAPRPLQPRMTVGTPSAQPSLKSQHACRNYKKTGHRSLKATAATGPTNNVRTLRTHSASEGTASPRTRRSPIGKVQCARFPR